MLNPLARQTIRRVRLTRPASSPSFPSAPRLSLDGGLLTIPTAAPLAIFTIHFLRLTLAHRRLFHNFRVRWESSRSPLKSQPLKWWRLPLLRWPYRSWFLASHKESPLSGGFPYLLPFSGRKFWNCLDSDHRIRTAAGSNNSLRALQRALPPSIAQARLMA